MNRKIIKAMSVTMITALAGFVVAQTQSPSHFRLHLKNGQCLSWPVEQVDNIKYFDLSSESELSIALQEAGTLSASVDDKDLSGVTRLALSGNINAEDIRFISANMPSLLSLDLGACTIEAYAGEDGDPGYAENEIPARAFENAAFVKEIVLPEGVVTIGEAAFSGCHSVSSLVFPSTLVAVGENAFRDNFSLRHVTVTTDVIPELGEDAFRSIYPGAVLTVPQGSGMDYLCSPWARYFRIFEEGDAETEITQEVSIEGLNAIMVDGKVPYRVDEKNNFILFKTEYAPGETDPKNMSLMLMPQEGYEVSISGEPYLGNKTVDLSAPLVLNVTDGLGETKEVVVALCYGAIPTIYINTKDAAPIESKEEYMKNTEVYVFNSPNDCRYVDASVKGRGNSSWTLPKKPYNIKLNKKDKFAGFPKHKTFALVANHSDKTLLRNSLSYEMARDIYDNMAWNPHTLSVHVVVNGSYDGVYSLTETTKIDSNRVDIPSIEDCPSIEEAGKYGFIFEANQRLDENLNITTPRGNKFTLKEPDGADISEELKEYVTQKLLEAEEIVYAHASEDADNYFGKHFDIDSFVDWYLVNEIGKNQDARYGNSCFLYFDPTDQKWHAGPVWDFDIAYGNINYSGTDTPDGFHVNTLRWPQHFFHYPEFVERVKTRWNEKKDDLRDFFVSKFTAEAAALAPDASMNFKRWDILGKYVWPNADGYESRNTYQSEVDYLIDWVNRRIDWLDEAINAL